MNVDSIIFDLDGTLWDSSEVILSSWNEVLKSYNEIEKQLSLEDLHSILGLQIKDIGKKLFPELDEEMHLKLLNHCIEVECTYLSKQGGKLYDNLEEALVKLSEKYKLFIVSNCQCGYIESFYESHKLDKFFLDFEHPGRTNLTKGENTKLIMDRNNLKAPLYVGDTEGDLKASRFAGIPFVFARYGFGKVSEYDHVIDNFTDLLKLLT